MASISARVLWRLHRLKSYQKLLELNHFFSNFRKGYRAFTETKTTPPDALYALRMLFVETNGWFNAIVSWYLSRTNPPDRSVKSCGILGDLSADQLEAIIDEIRKNGYHVFAQHLTEPIVKKVVQYAYQTPVRYLHVLKQDEEFGIRYSEELVQYNDKQTLSPRYQYTGEQIIGSQELQSIIFDESVLAVAQAYLKCRPVLDLIAMWWSAEFEGKGLSEAAQMYHFDMDRIKFLKFFFYLTDVDSKTGPHCFVRGSHRGLPKHLRRVGRLTDQEVEASFSKEDIVELEGVKGTIIAADTRGLHKGKALQTGDRLVFQMEFTNSMFGQNYPGIDRNAILSKYKPLIEKYPFTYGQLFQ